jgi:vacuolar-type H+-ATPase subunit H
MSKFQDPREDEALAALAAAALHPFNPDEEVSEEEALRFMSETGPLTEAEQQAVARIECDPQKWKSRQTFSGARSPSNKCGEVAAMHREKGGEELAPETKEEIDRRREEIRERLRKTRGSK